MSNTNNIKSTDVDQIRELIKDNEFYFVFLDDENDLHDIVVSMGVRFGLRVYATDSPEDALSFIRAKQSQIVYVISDYKMPGMNGFDFRKKVLEINSSIPFVILSAYVNREMALQGIDLKISGFIDKPLNDGRFNELVMVDGLKRIKSLLEDLEILKGFVDEASGNLEHAEEIILRLENDPNDMDAINGLFGIVHTVKGGSGFFEPKTLNRFAHRFEEILKQLQRRELYPTDEVVSAVLKGIDTLKMFVEEFRTTNHGSHDVEQLLNDVFTFRKTQTTTADIERAAMKQETLKEHVAGAAPNAAGGGQGAVQQKGPSDLKVAVSLLDEFMQISGEMTVIRNMLNKCVRAIEKQYKGDKDVSMLVELLAELHKINGNVQAKITELRKVPVKNILKPLPRAIRDVAGMLSKEVEFTTVGDDLRVDTAIAEVLGNSLIHIVRNSIDHGIEKPAEREKIGKSRKGRINITSLQKNESVIIEIEDDGRGISTDAIKNRLIKNGSHTLQQLDKMREEEIFMMIFEAGFSTAETVTDISGRGVGMSMVKSSVEAVGGKIHISSMASMGSRFILELPIPKSVLITNCLFVNSSGMQLGIPQDDIVRVLQITPENRPNLVYPLEGAKALKMNDEMIPVVGLETILGRTANDEKENQDTNIVVITSDHRKLALEVDQVLDVEDTVIKPVQGLIRALELYKGATFLGDGTVGMIMNSEGMFHSAGVKGSPRKVNTENNDQTKEGFTRKRKSETTDILLFELNTEGLYSVPRKSIFRIEEFTQEHLHSSGENIVIPYRGHVLTLADVEAVLFGEKQDFSRYGDTIPSIIVEDRGFYIGFAVKKILDIGEVSGAAMPLPRSQDGIMGNFILDGKTVTALDLDCLLDMVSSREAMSEAEDDGTQEYSTQEAA